METVNILFQNIQSHENTEFTLKPGMNFILADGNNVGKSTIFKVISRVAKAPNLQSNKILPLIRYGMSEAIAAFRYLDECVIAHFTKYENEAAKMFFEHVHPDGQVTRSVFCPKSLLDALGVVVDSKGNIINFNDANSVQLISEVSTEADSIITHVMLDPKVETVKSNMYMLGKEVNMDLRSITAQVQAAESIVKDLTYKPEVEEFFQFQEKMAAACRICDYGITPVSEQKVIPSERDMEAMRVFLNVAAGLDSYLTAQAKDPLGSCDLGYGKLLLKLSECVNVESYSSLEKVITASEELDRWKKCYSLVTKLSSALRSAEEMQSVSKVLQKDIVERSEILREIKNNSVEVDCPIKGKVAYTDEKCVPYSS